jgi:uncharacterized membrane protein
MAKAADKAAAGDKAVEDHAVAVRPPMISDYGLALTVYVLYLLGFFTGLTAVVGLIIASMQVDRAEPVSRSHFRFQVRTFWIGLLFVFVGVVALHVAIGGLILLWWVVWTLIRCVKGLLALNAGEPIADPESWFFG